MSPERTEKLSALAYDDGYRVARKGIGVSKTGKYQYSVLTRIMARWAVRFAYFDFSIMQKEGIDQDWMLGWHDGLDARTPVGGDPLTQTEATWR